MGRRRPSVRLIDLHVRWLWQYAPELAGYDPELVSVLPGRLRQTAGYLSDTAAAVVMIGGGRADVDPWWALGEDLARVAAEFCGRLLLEPEDVERWRAEPSGGPCWAVPGIAGLDWLLRGEADLERLPPALERVRVVQLATRAVGTLAVEEGLTPLGLAAMAILERAAAARPIALELAGLSPLARAAVLERASAGLIPLYCHAAAPDDPPLPSEDAARIVDAGGLVADLPGAEGGQGNAIATGFLGRDLAAGAPGNAGAVLRWAASGRDESEFQEFAQGRAAALSLRLAGTR